jgi:hypothetical protein
MQDKIVLSVPQFNQIKPYSCIPACLQEVFGYYGESITQEEIMKTSENPKMGMSLIEVGIFSLKHNYKPLIITNNVNIFDPTWFKLDSTKLKLNLKKRAKFVDDLNQFMIDKYIKFLNLGGEINFETISPALFEKYLSMEIPIIMELASTFLYKLAKSSHPGGFDDAIRGQIEGHGVVIAGFDKKDKFLIIDPNSKKSPSKTGVYWVDGAELMMSFALLEGKSLLLLQKSDSD